MSDNKTEYPFGYSLAEMDTEAFFNLRGWLRKAIEAHGAEVTDSGIGAGQADLAFNMDGGRFEVSIRPLPMRKPSPAEGG